MRKAWVITANILIILLVIGFVIAYAGKHNRDYVASRVKAFEDRTYAEEQITANYLRGQQQLCDSWAAYIRTHRLTMDEAVSFVRGSLSQTGVTAAILYADTPDMNGLSASPKNGTEDDYAVSYRQINLFPEDGIGADLPEGRISMTRAYTNPINGIQSIAFYDSVTLTEDGGERQALLLQIVPISLLEEQWIFPKEEYQNAEVSLIDAEGNYIIRSKSFKNTNFYEFYKSYNATDLAGIEALKNAVTSSTGSVMLRNSKNQECLIAHTPMQDSDGWSILAYLRADDLGTGAVDWLLIGVVTAALLLLLIVDSAVMLNFNNRLRAAVKEAESANRAKTDFLSTMSHDIRTPMNAIIGLTAIGEKNLDDRDSVKDCFRKIGMAGNHLLTLINDILDISKVESGRLTLNAADFSIVETAENLVNLSQPMVKEKNIEFSFRVSGIEQEWLFADQLRLNQIYINLLSNAVKYTEPGGSVSVTLSEEPAEDGAVLLTYVVADTGMGMTPEFMEKMYQPFSRQTDSRVNTIQGTGLGLAITKQMVELMDGSIDCESEPGKGTTFTVRLKLPAAKRRPAEMALPDADVLVVDDDEVLCETAVDTLHSLGARADSASCAEEALEKILERHREGRDWSAIILDWKMPGMDGAALARRIRQEIGDGVPILLVSAYDWSDIEEEAKNAGVNGFVSKPLFRSTLYRKLNELLGREQDVQTEEDSNSDLAGMKILVAEDNDINWEIISMLMQMNGIECDRAENGQLAVDRIREAPADRYDLVFMDIQMPVMNGLDATKAIRALPVGHAKTIPIIAMTADAFSENVAECLDAGMNGHIAKPIDINIVLKEIRKIKEEKQQ
ncbi:MAG: response regulator [Ruminococcaceae bacterium]|nr:response regulator [Oscillospiraceae bacterium]